MKRETVPLGEIALINPRQKAIDPGQICSFVPMDAVGDDTGRLSYTLPRKVMEVQRGYTAFAENDVLFAKITPCMENGKAAIARQLENGIGYGSTEFHVIRASEETMPEWVFYFLRKRSTRELAERFMTGSAGQKRVPSSFLLEVEIPKPRINVQKHLVQRLERADRLRRLRQHALDISDQYLQTVFLEMFGDTRANPNGWDRVTVEDVAEVQGGLQVTKRRDTLALKVPYLRVANSYRYSLDLTEVKWMGVTEAELRRTMLQLNDILCVEGHGNINEVGRASLWQGELPLCTHQNHLIRVRANPEKVNPSYLCFFLNSSEGRAYLRETSNTTSGLNTISTGTVRECPVLVPPGPQQERFAQVVYKHERLRQMQVEALRQANLLYETLLEEAFGEQ